MNTIHKKQEGRGVGAGWSATGPAQSWDHTTVSSSPENPTTTAAPGSMPDMGPYICSLSPAEGYRMGSGSHPPPPQGWCSLSPPSSGLAHERGRQSYGLPPRCPLPKTPGLALLCRPSHREDTHSFLWTQPHIRSLSHSAGLGPEPG